MEAFREEKAALESRNVAVIAVSTDPAGRLAKFRAAVGADFRFVPDPKAEIVSLYGVRMPLVKVAKRQTFAIGRDRRILEIFGGSDAVDVAPAIEACPLPAAD